MFYVGQWYKEIFDEGEATKQRLKQVKSSTEMNDKEKRKYEKKTEKVFIKISIKPFGKCVLHVFKVHAYV